MTAIYPFDPTGLAESNFIKDEAQVLTDANDTTYSIIIPDFAPFYQDNLRIVHYGQNGEKIPLTNGVDYTLVMPYIAASRSIGKSIFGAVSINTTLASGVLGVDYRTLGSDWVCDKRWVLEQLVTKLYNPRTVYWDQITNVQQTFPPVNHPVDLKDVYGLRALMDKFDELINLIASRPDLQSQLSAHMATKGNVHELTATDIELGNVPNLPMATLDEVRAARPVDKFVSLRLLVESGLIRPQ